MQTDHSISDIAGTLKISVLQNELEKQNIPVDYILRKANDFTIFYTRTLTTAESNTITTIIAAHNADEVLLQSRKIQITRSASSPGFQVLAKFILDGEFREEVHSIDILSRGDLYTVRFYDVDKNKILGSGTFTNSDWHVNKITVMDISDSPTTVELQVKSQQAEIQEISINYI